MTGPTLHPPPVASTDTSSFVWQEWFRILYLKVKENMWNFIQLSSDSVVSSTSFTNVSGMSFNGDANTTYMVKLVGAYQTAASTTGMWVALDIPSGSVIGIETTTPSVATIGGTGQNADNSNMGSPSTTLASVNLPIHAEWVIKIGATGGTVQLTQRSTVAASNTTLKANLSVLSYKQI